MSRVLDEVMREYHERFPGTDAARRSDMYTYVAWNLMHQMLSTADWVLATEEADTRLHYRILQAMALGAPNPVDAQWRMEREQAFLDAMKYQSVPPVYVATQEQLDRLAAGGDWKDVADA